MGTKGREIVGVDTSELIKKLNYAYADEWLAMYQYWIGAKVAQGPMRKSLEFELREHAMEELEHADKLADRVLQLQGSPILRPEDWYKMNNCGYEAPTDHSVKTLLEQNIKGEQCAIRVYKDILDFVEGKDHITYKLILDILEDEVEHEEELEALLEDIKTVETK